MTHVGEDFPHAQQLKLDKEKKVEN